MAYGDPPDLPWCDAIGYIRPTHSTVALLPGESATCGNCGKIICGPGAWGITPNAICTCCDHDRRPLKPLQGATHGCICPPGSEKTCQGLDCPRRPPSSYGCAGWING